MKHFSQKKPNKQDRELAVLLGLVELYLQTGRPVGSHTLKECGFDAFSPATLRNYFASLEEQGFLKQQHSSGGRIPTNLAYRLYAKSCCSNAELPPNEKQQLTTLLMKETREVHLYLQKAAETLSSWSQSAVFLSTPRFDQDFVLEVKLISLDPNRLLCVLITDFGTIRSEVLFLDKKLSHFSTKRLEQFFYWKLTGQDKPSLSEDEEKSAQALYNEAMLRHLVNYSHFSTNDLVKTGFAKMLLYPDFTDASSLASGLSLFENDAALASLLSESCKQKEPSFRIGEDLGEISPLATVCSTLVVPYAIDEVFVGAIGLLCPSRTPYKKHFALLKTASFIISESLTKSLHKFKISYRQPKAEQLDFHKQTILLTEKERIGSLPFLENQPQQKE